MNEERCKYCGLKVKNLDEHILLHKSNNDEIPLEYTPPVPSETRSDLKFRDIEEFYPHTDYLPPSKETIMDEFTQTQYDNEWVKFMSQLSKNNSVKDIADYISKVHWSRRQKQTIMAYSQVILGNSFATTRFTDHRDYRMLYDDKALIDCDLTVGLTRFDLTPEWNILIGMINIHFGAVARMSKGGWFVGRIGAQRHEIVQEERTRDHTQGFKEKIENKFVGD